MVWVAAILWTLCPLTTRADELPLKDLSKSSGQKFILDNGLTVLTYEMPTSTTVAVYVMVKVGSATEGEHMGTGISHFVEHMLFKGTETRVVGQIGQEVKALGGMINASTSFDYTVYLIELPNQYYGHGIEIMADMLINSKIDPEEVEKERKVIFGEVRLYRDNPLRKLSDLIQTNVFLQHPYKHPVIGYDSLLDKISRDALWKYYKKFYIPSNMVVAIAGNIKTEEVLAEVKKAFADFPRQPDVLRNLPQEPPQLTERYYEEEYPTDITRLDMAYHSVGILDEDGYALDVLSMILGEGWSSRLKREIYDKKRLVSSIRSSNYTPVDAGLFEIEAELELVNVSNVIQAVKEQIELIKTKGVLGEEMEKAKAQVLSGRIFSKQTAGAMAYQMAYDEAFTGDYRFSDKYVDAVGRLKPSDIQRVTNRYLKDSNLTTVVLKPLGSKKTEESKSEETKSTEIKKIVLDNGLRILLREDHTLPIISVRLVLLGGTRQEPFALNGLSHLMTRLWVRETKSLSMAELAKITAAKGVSIGEIFGRNSYGIDFYGLSKYLNLGLDLMEDIVKNPRFSQDEFLKDKELMKVVIKSQNEDLGTVTSRNVRQELFVDHPFSLDEVGTLESIEKIQHKDVIDLYKRLTVPNNMVLAVFGDFKEEDVLVLLKKKFGNLVAADVRLVDYSVTPPTNMRERTVFMDKEQTMVMIGFQGPKMSDQDAYGISVIRSILGSSLSGRMFHKIRDQLGQAYTLGGGYTPGLDTGFIYFYVNTTDENAAKVKEILLEQIRELQTNEVEEEELNSTKMYLKGTFQRSLETSSSLGSIAIFDELYGLGFDHYKSYNEEIDRITKADLQRIAHQYLDLNKAAIVFTRPKKNQEPVGEMAIPSANETANSYLQP